MYTFLFEIQPLLSLTSGRKELRHSDQWSSLSNILKYSFLRQSPFKGKLGENMKGVGNNSHYLWKLPTIDNDRIAWTIDSVAEVPHINKIILKINIRNTHFKISQSSEQW